MLDEEDGPESVDLKRGERVGVRDGARGFLRMEDPRDTKSEPERRIGETGLAMSGGCGDCVLLCRDWYADQ